MAYSLIVYEIAHKESLKCLKLIPLSRIGIHVYKCMCFSAI